jgi:CheY-like chemotaxis protein
VVESVKGLGSKFSISLPGIEQDESEPASEMPPVTGTTRRRPLILVAEDDPFGFLYLELTLNNSYEILRAEDGAEAVELCRMNPEIQLVLMDVKMPNMNGLLATQEIKKTRPDLPIIILSAYAEAGMEDKCMKAGCDLYLSKPINKKDMFSTLAKFGFPPN